jgi:integrase/recombinase XerD
MIQIKSGGLSMSVSVFERIFEHNVLRKRHREAPLLQEREQYLLHMLERGTSGRAVRSLATMLLHIVRLLDIKALRMIDLAEIEQASSRWKTDPGFYRGRRPGSTSCHSFAYMAVGFFKFHNVMDQHALPVGPNDVIVRRFSSLPQRNPRNEARRS